MSRIAFLLLGSAFAAAYPTLPHSHACLPPLDTFPWCDSSLPTQSRVDALVGALTLAEKISLMQDGQPSIDRLGMSCRAT